MEFNYEVLDQFIDDLEEDYDDLSDIVRSLENIQVLAESNSTNGFLENVDMTRIVSEVSKFQEEQLLGLKEHLIVIKESLIKVDKNICRELE